MKIIDETDKLKLEIEQESSVLTEKTSGIILLNEQFYGNPSCGIIDPENNWAIVAGIHLTFWKPSKTIKYHNENFEWIHSIRIKDKNTVEILTDPWSEKSSVWELNTENAELKKIKDFPEYINKEYTELVNW
ncbi:hypothetical protein SAMN05421796_1212 [Chryseobacterium piscicola]|uniref:Uncharacterized protein n=1 Tax=Chryseobacterium piscicola TaxID=551459 RepID=A0A1N7PK41_9FLAO|nr:hypothetical protein [Chryseobacterium piscicola]PQA93923.1 hypothetical protein B0A70_09060 [Chryseobacterium piscicola]SIT10877.1 hypothetical protein SAMN05421796_1212 [Chryseobacterium piscicola]